MSRIDFLAPTLETVTGYFARFGLDEGVEFVPGFFEQTLERLRGRRWSLVRLDADSYRATQVALDVLYPGLSSGGFVVVDDYFHPFLPESCRKAVDDFRAEHSIAEPIERIDWNAARWRKLRESATATGPPSPETVEAPEPAATVARREPESPIPSDWELQLQDEVARLTTELHLARAELERYAEPRVARLIAHARRHVNRS